MTKLLISAATLAIATAVAPAAFAGGHADYTIGVSNTVQGNGWREEMICAMRAQALVEGDVSGLIVAHRNTDSAGQLEDLNAVVKPLWLPLLLSASCDVVGVLPGLL